MIDPSNLTYTILDFDENSRVVFLQIDENESLNLSLPFPLPATIEELDSIIQNYLPPLESYVEAPDVPDLSYIRDRKGMSRTIARRTLGDLPTTQLPLEAFRAKRAKEIDDGIAAIYERFQRFQTEYEGREKAALAYAADSTLPQVVSIATFASGAGLTYAAAVERVLFQAAQLRGAVEALGNLRMRKYEILMAEERPAINAAFDDIMTKASIIAAAL